MKRLHILFFIIPVLILILLCGMSFPIHVVAPSISSSLHREYTGSLFVSDAGQSHGGFEYTATWSASMRLLGTSGVLNLTLKIGLGDALTQHVFAITNFRTGSSGNELSFLISGTEIGMTNMTADVIWNGTFNNYYVASWGGYAPSNEIIGSITPKVFPGLADFWYVELRLR